MIIEDAFGYKIIRIQCDDESLYHNEYLNKSVTHVLNMPAVSNRKRYDSGDSHKGSGLTSVGQPYLDLIYLPGASNLTQWVTQQLLSVQNQFGFTDATSIHYKRSWANRLFRGGQGLCHNHVKLDTYMREMTEYTSENFRPDAVAIFYVDVPENSSDLVFIRNGKDDTYLEDYNESDRYHLKPIQGELVIHSPDVWHAVSVHNSDLPRNVFVFDTDYIK
jgi:hypothetical protein